MDLNKTTFGWASSFASPEIPATFQIQESLKPFTFLLLLSFVLLFFLVIVRLHFTKRSDVLIVKG